MSVAFVIWILDFTRVVCAPASWVQGHAVWHIMLAPNCIDHDPIPRQEKGAAGFLTWMRTVRGAFPDFYGTIGDVIAEDDLVAARVTWQGTHGGNFFGIEPNGHKVSFQAMHIMRMLDGRAAEWWGTADLFSALRQLGGTVAASPALPDRIE